MISTKAVGTLKLDGKTCNFSKAQIWHLSLTAAYKNEWPI